MTYHETVIIEGVNFSLFFWHLSRWNITLFLKLWPSVFIISNHWTRFQRLPEIEIINLMSLSLFCEVFEKNPNNTFILVHLRNFLGQCRKLDFIYVCHDFLPLSWTCNIRHTRVFFWVWKPHLVCTQVLSFHELRWLVHLDT